MQIQITRIDARTRQTSESASKREFADSAEATDYIADTYSALVDKRLKAWAKETDRNFGSKTSVLLEKATKAFSEFNEAVLLAGE